MESLLQKFVSETNADLDLARELLEGNNWDYPEAKIAYDNINMASKIPNSPSGRRIGTSSANGTPTGSPAKPPLQKSLAFDDDFYDRKLKRGISRATDNVQIIDQARRIVLKDIKESTFDHTHYFGGTPEYTFILPDLTVFPEDFRAFLEKDLIETSTLVSLEQAGRLNWWADTGACQRLWPLATTGDGNCLLHAASLGMWGFHDRPLTLRTALYETLANGETHGALWRRWRWQQTQVNKEASLIYSEEEWQREWDSLLSLASTKPRSHSGKETSCCHSPATNGAMEQLDEESTAFYESLEEIHVFVLAHVLRRPVIVVADVMLKDCNGDALAPIPFGGIYLPFEVEPKKCHRSPLVLTYDAAHFSALVAMSRQNIPQCAKSKVPAVIPLVDPEFKLLPLHFAVDVGPKFTWSKDELDDEKTKSYILSPEQKLALLERYLDVVRVPIPKHHTEYVNSKESVNTIDSDECKSSSGSCESEENNAKEKSKVAKQMHTVAKQFGSIGKSMSRKIKKNFGGIGKAMKISNVETGTLSKAKRKQSLGGSATQTTKTTLTVEMLKDRDHILCAKLNLKRADYQEDMVQNYMDSARKRFEADKEMKRKRNTEMKQKADERRATYDAAHGTIKCISPNCQGFGCEEHCYLCPACFAQQKQEALNLQNAKTVKKVDSKSNLVTITYNGTQQSKYYTAVDDISKNNGKSGSTGLLNNKILEQPSRGLNLKNASLFNGSLSSSLPEVRAVPLHADSNSGSKKFISPPGSPQKARSPLAADTKQTGYDNLDYNMDNGVSPESPTGSEASGGSYTCRQKCRSSSCSFFGSEEYDFLCSACFKEKQRSLGYIEDCGRQTKL